MGSYRIRDWNTHFENNRTRELKKMEWVPVPNKMDGSGYTELVDHENGAAHLGAWYAILEISSRQKVRGTIPQEGAARCGSIPQDLAATCRCLSRISHLPESVFNEVIPRLLTIGWLEEVELLQNLSNRTIPHEGAEECLSRARNGMEWNGMEKTNTHTESSPLCLPDRFSEFIEGWPRVRNPDAACQAWLSCVLAPSDVVGVFAAKSRYLASDEVSRGVLTDPAKWLMEQKNARWAGRWPVARGAKLTPSQIALNRAREQEGNGKC